MKNQKTQALINEIVTGLLITATFALAAPVAALAQNLHAVGLAAQQGIMVPFVQFSSDISYALGTVMTVAGIAGCKKHADNAGSNPLAPALGRLGAGAAFLSAPAVAGMLAGTSSSSGITGVATYSGIGGF